MNVTVRFAYIQVENTNQW